MLNLKGITFAYKAGLRNILEEISFAVKKNETIAILGNNGAGKSTLLKCVNRILRPQKGAVLVNGANVYDMTRLEAARNISYVAQTGNCSNMTVFDAILLGRKPYITWDATREDLNIVHNIIQKMRLSDFALRNLSELSGGEAQKVMLARALAQEPKLLLLDEPTSNLDPKNQHEVLGIVKQIAKEHNICVVIVIHDLNLAIRYCDRFLFLKDAQVYAYGGHEVMTPGNIEAVYGIHVHIIEHKNVKVIIPFPEEEVLEPLHSTAVLNSKMSVNL